MYLNIIGPPGAGKSTLVKRLGFENDCVNINRLDEKAFWYYESHGFFEHTGHNVLVNKFLKENDVECITIHLNKPFLICLFNILRDKSRKHYFGRIKLLFYCKLTKKPVFTKGTVIKWKS